MIPFPFEVVPAEPDGFTWRIIGACGRPLLYSLERFPSDFAAASAAKAVRAHVGEVAQRVDGFTV